MSTRKLQRLVRAVIRTSGCEVVEVTSPNSHYQYTLRLPNGATRNLVVSCSPTVFEHTLKSVAKDLKRLIAETPPPPTA